MTFGGRNGRFKAYSLARLLRKLEQEQSVVSVVFCAWVWLARLAADFCAVSVAAAAGARGAGPAAPFARRTCPRCGRCPCVVVSRMHPPPLWPRLCGPSREATQAGGAARETQGVQFCRMEAERSLGAVARPESLMVAPSRLLSVVHVLG